MACWSNTNIKSLFYKFHNVDIFRRLKEEINIRTSVPQDSAEQAGIHCLFIHEWEPEQSSSFLQPILEHSISGLPSKPCLHVHTGLWFFTRQSASVPHVHGFLQMLLIHDLSSGHSLSATQAATITDTGLHVPLPLLIYPGGHTQIIVRTGIDGTT